MINKKYYRLAYEYHQRWSPCPATAEQWERAAADGKRICSENGNDPFLRALLVAVYQDLSRTKDQNTR